MVGFLIKKSFFDGWDNLIGMVLENLLFDGWFLLVLLVAGYAETLGVFTVVLLIALLFLFSVLQAGTGASCHAWARYERTGAAGFKKGIVQSWRHIVFYWLCLVFYILLWTYVIRFYFALQTTVGLVIGMMLVWLAVFFLLSLLYYWPLHYMMEGDRPTKTLKKCFLFNLDNTGKTIFLGFYLLVQVVITVFTFGLIPGVAGWMVTKADMGKLLMLKYDYLEKNPAADRKHLPWYDITYDDRESVGPRTLKGMLFPWKE